MRDVHMPWDRGLRKVGAWLRALRLQFYPMTWIAYTVGALGASGGTATLPVVTYWVGYSCLFLLEAATVMTNDYFDYASDRENEHYSRFTGGSRVLVEQVLQPAELLRGATVAIGLAGAAAFVLVWVAPASAAKILLPLLILCVLALGYTLPPLRLSHRGLGEVDVALTHSAGVVLCGYLFHGGSAGDAFPWLVSVPLFFAVLPAILLAGIPDVVADRTAGKVTLVVKVGPRRAIELAMLFTLLAAASGVGRHVGGFAEDAYGSLIYLAVPHAVLLLYTLHRYRRRYQCPERIDRLIALALAYILWFGVVPLVGLL